MLTNHAAVSHSFEQLFSFRFSQRFTVVESILRYLLFFIDRPECAGVHHRACKRDKWKGPSELRCHLHASGKPTATRLTWEHLLTPTQHRTAAGLIDTQHNRCFGGPFHRDGAFDDDRHSFMDRCVVMNTMSASSSPHEQTADDSYINIRLE